MNSMSPPRAAPAKKTISQLLDDLRAYVSNGNR